MGRTARAIGAAGAALLLLGASSSQTWTIDPGGHTLGFGEDVFFQIDGGSSVTCALSVAEGEFMVGSGLSGDKISRIDSLTLETPGNPHNNACSGPSGITVSITPQGLPYYANLKRFDPSSGKITLTVTGDDSAGVYGTAHASDECDADVGGEGGEPGVIEMTYQPSEGLFTAAGSNLIITDLDDGTNGRPQECDPSLIQRGKAVTINAEYFIDPFQDIRPDNTN